MVGVSCFSLLASLSLFRMEVRSFQFRSSFYYGLDFISDDECSLEETKEALVFCSDWTGSSGPYDVPYFKSQVVHMTGILIGYVLSFITYFLFRLAKEKFDEPR